MKRDMDLVRKIAFALEETPKGYVILPFTIDGYCDGEVGYHVLIMMEAGLVEGQRSQHIKLGPIGLPGRLTWQGHEFVESARNDTLWNKAKTQIAEKVGGVTIGLLVEYLKHLGKQQLGLE